MRRVYLLATSIAACSDPGTVATVTVTASDTTVEVGQVVQLTATAREAGGAILDRRPVEWSSTDPGVVLVSPAGLATAVAPGSVEVRATVDGVIGSLELAAVAPPPATPSPVASVTVTAPAATVLVGNRLQLTATARDAAGAVLEGRQFEWSSTDLGRATVSTAGEVSGISPGEVEIRATSEGVTGQLSITVVPPPPPSDVGLQEVASGIVFPVYLTSPPSDERLFVLEKDGKIRIIKDGVLLESPFLDITSLVSKAREQGLLGLAFPPDYATGGRFIVHYTDQDGNTRVSSFQVSANPDLADPASEVPLLVADQPFVNHNGGQILFGPDGLLYIGLGDGGSSGDPGRRGQSLADLLGSILRIDVSGGTSYTVPPDNPFVGTPGARTEVWSYGLRNPWRFSFDRATGDLYIADVGQANWEEVNYASAGTGAGRGVNYGWSIMEGLQCFGANPCDQDGLTLPVVQYGHDQGCSITGGYVYRGTAVRSLQGHYLYADFCRGWVRSFQAGDPATVVERPSLEPGGSITSFGEDAAGEMYLLTEDGRVLKIVPR
jgi:glucose/arabinose dehydrogenase